MRPCRIPKRIWCYFSVRGRPTACWSGTSSSSLSDLRGFVDSGYPPAGIVTDASVRYGVAEVHQATLLDSTDSRRQPRSRSPGTYVLEFDPVYKVCARVYSVKIGGRSRTVTYIDAHDGKAYDFPLRTSRPFRIHRVEINPVNVLRDLWEDWHRKHG